MPWYCTCIMRPFAHSPPSPNLTGAVDGLEGGLADVVGELVVLEAVGALDGVAEHLDVGVAPAAQIVAERIDALGLGARPGTS